MATWANETTPTFDDATNVTQNGSSPTASSTSWVDYDNYVYGDYEYDFMYQGYPFEKTIYLYVWEILVIMTFLFNVVVISVLLRKKMRNPTYMILVAISISDSLTGLVTLPTYISVFRHDSHTMYGAQHGRSDVPPDNYFISENLCDLFMISKFFLSKSFHTVSVWLTLFLGFQRFMCVFSPFEGLARVFTTKVTVSVCVSIFILAPFLHIYHLFNDKSDLNFECKWVLKTGSDCVEDCAYLWLALVLSHLLPAILLTVFTILFIHSLWKSMHSLRITATRSNSNAISVNVTRQRENRRASIVVTAIVIVFLIPELPYCCFFLYNAISAHSSQNTNLMANRAIHAAYEVLLVLSFNANFYIYTFFNRRFRKLLWETIISPVYTTTCVRVCPGTCRLEGKFRISSIFSRRTMHTSSRSGSAVEMTGMKNLQTQSSSGSESPTNKENNDQNNHSMRI